MSDMLIPAPDGTHRIIESEAIRALVGYLSAVSDEDVPVRPEQAADDLPGVPPW